MINFIFTSFSVILWKLLVMELLIKSHCNSAPIVECPKDVCECNTILRNMVCECSDDACIEFDTKNKMPMEAHDKNKISFSDKKLPFQKITINGIKSVYDNLFQATILTQNTTITLYSVKYIAPNAFNIPNKATKIEIYYDTMPEFQENSFNGLSCRNMALFATHTNHGFNINIFTKNTVIENLALYYEPTEYLKQAFYSDTKTSQFSIESWTSDATVKTLEILDLKCKQILDETWAPKFNGLETIFIYRTDLKVISENFIKLHSDTLKSFIFRENKLETIEQNTFSRFKTLKLIDLSDNPIKYIDQASFNGLSSLKHLDLQGISSTYQIDNSDFCTMAYLPCGTTIYLDKTPFFSCTLGLLNLMATNKESYRSIDAMPHLEYSQEQVQELDYECKFQITVESCYDKMKPKTQNCLFNTYNLTLSENTDELDGKNKIFNDFPTLIQEEEECFMRLNMSKIPQTKSTRTTRRMTAPETTTTTIEITTTTTITTSTTTTLTKLQRTTTTSTITQKLTTQRTTTTQTRRQTTSTTTQTTTTTAKPTTTTKTKTTTTTIIMTTPEITTAEPIATTTEIIETTTKRQAKGKHQVRNLTIPFTRKTSSASTQEYRTTTMAITTTTTTTTGTIANNNQDNNEYQNRRTTLSRFSNQNQIDPYNQRRTTRYGEVITTRKSTERFNNKNDDEDDDDENTNNENKNKNIQDKNDFNNKRTTRRYTRYGEMVTTLKTSQQSEIRDDNRSDENDDNNKNVKDNNQISYRRTTLSRIDGANTGRLTSHGGMVNTRKVTQKSENNENSKFEETENGSNNINDSNNKRTTRRSTRFGEVITARRTTFQPGNKDENEDETDGTNDYKNNNDGKYNNNKDKTVYNYKLTTLTNFLGSNQIDRSNTKRSTRYGEAISTKKYVDNDSNDENPDNNEKPEYGNNKNRLTTRRSTRFGEVMTTRKRTQEDIDGDESKNNIETDNNNKINSNNKRTTRKQSQNNEERDNDNDVTGNNDKEKDGFDKNLNKNDESKQKQINQTNTRRTTRFREVVITKQTLEKGENTDQDINYNENGNTVDSDNEAEDDVNQNKGINGDSNINKRPTTRRPTRYGEMSTRKTDQKPKKDIDTTINKDEDSEDDSESENGKNKINKNDKDSNYKRTSKWATRFGDTILTTRKMTKQSENEGLNESDTDDATGDKNDAGDNTTKKSNQINDNKKRTTKKPIRFDGESGKASQKVKNNENENDIENDDDDERETQNENNKNMNVSSQKRTTKKLNNYGEDVTTRKPGKEIGNNDNKDKLNSKRPIGYDESEKTGKPSDAFENNNESENNDNNDNPFDNYDAQDDNDKTNKRTTRSSTRYGEVITTRKRPNDDKENDDIDRNGDKYNNNNSNNKRTTRRQTQNNGDDDNDQEEDDNKNTNNKKINKFTSKRPGEVTRKNPQGINSDGTDDNNESENDNNKISENKRTTKKKSQNNEEHGNNDTDDEKLKDNKDNNNIKFKRTTKRYYGNVTTGKYNKEFENDHNTETIDNDGTDDAHDNNKNNFKRTTAKGSSGHNRIDQGNTRRSTRYGEAVTKKSNKQSDNQEDTEHNSDDGTDGNNNEDGTENNNDGYSKENTDNKRTTGKQFQNNDESDDDTYDDAKNKNNNRSKKTTKRSTVHGGTKRKNNDQIDLNNENRNSDNDNNNNTDSKYVEDERKRMEIEDNYDDDTRDNKENGDTKQIKGNNDSKDRHSTRRPTRIDGSTRKTVKEKSEDEDDNHNETNGDTKDEQGNKKQTKYIPKKTHTTRQQTHIGKDIDEKKVGKKSGNYSEHEDNYDDSEGNYEGQENDLKKTNDANEKRTTRKKTRPDNVMMTKRPGKQSENDLNRENNYDDNETSDNDQSHEANDKTIKNTDDEENGDSYTKHSTKRLPGAVTTRKMTKNDENVRNYEEYPDVEDNNNAKLKRTTSFSTPGRVKTKIPTRYGHIMSTKPGKQFENNVNFGEDGTDTSDYDDRLDEHERRTKDNYDDSGGNIEAKNGNKKQTKDSNYVNDKDNTRRSTRYGEMKTTRKTGKELENKNTDNNNKKTKSSNDPILKRTTMPNIPGQNQIKTKRSTRYGEVTTKRIIQQGEDNYGYDNGYSDDNNDNHFNNPNGPDSYNNNNRGDSNRKTGDDDGSSWDDQSFNVDRPDYPGASFTRWPIRTSTLPRIATVISGNAGNNFKCPSHVPLSYCRMLSSYHVSNLEPVYIIARTSRRYRYFSSTLAPKAGEESLSGSDNNYDDALNTVAASSRDGTTSLYYRTPIYRILAHTFATKRSKNVTNSNDAINENEFIVDQNDSSVGSKGFFDSEWKIKLLLIIVAVVCGVCLIHICICCVRCLKSNRKSNDRRLIKDNINNNNNNNNNREENEVE